MAWCKHITEEIDLNLQSEGPELGSGVASDFQILAQNVVFARTHVGSFQGGVSFLKNKRFKNLFFRQISKHNYMNMLEKEHPR